MAVFMDDMTTYLARDSDNIAIMVARNVQTAMDVCRRYGCSIQVNMPSGKGIRVVATLADAIAIIGVLPADTPWCVGNYEGWDMGILAKLTSFFGPCKTIADALGVKNVGTAWRPELIQLV